jgi:hypothetical protein
VRIEFGALARPLYHQIRGYLPAASLRHFQADADAITRLKIRGLIPDKAAERARLRLIRDMERPHREWKAGP